MSRSSLLTVLIVVVYALATPASAQPAPSACQTDAGCPKGELCNNANVCQAFVCPLYHLPVCGFDGNTYSNPCFARLAHAAVFQFGECPADLQVCGGFAGLPCPRNNSFCEFPPDMCGVIDYLGLCFVRPVACPDLYDPVCGCDGFTYSNDCERRVASAQLEHHGECGAPTPARLSPRQSAFRVMPRNENPFPAVLGQFGSYDLIFTKGVLDLGVECLNVTGTQHYSLTGVNADEASGLMGAEVCVVGLKVEFSICMEGETLSVLWIGWCEDD